jgi:hypothetical protein
MTVNEVYRKIKEISAEQWHPRPVISIASISLQLHVQREKLMPYLSELCDMKLIKFNEGAKTNIKLTLLGNNVSRTRQ